MCIIPSCKLALLSDRIFPTRKSFSCQEKKNRGETSIFSLMGHCLKVPQPFSQPILAKLKYITVASNTKKLAESRDTQWKQLGSQSPAMQTNSAYLASDKANGQHNHPISSVEFGSFCLTSICID